MILQQVFLAQSNATLNRFTDKMKSLFNEKFNDLYSGSKKPQLSKNADKTKVIFVLPLSGRYETFLRFLNNFEDVSFGLSLIFGVRLTVNLDILDCLER